MNDIVAEAKDLDRQWLDAMARDALHEERRLSMAYKRKVLVKLEGQELEEYLRAWRSRWGFMLLLDDMIRKRSQIELDYAEAWDAVRERHGLPDTRAVRFDAVTGEFFEQVYGEGQTTKEAE